jgi:hypothetical protein
MFGSGCDNITALLVNRYVSFIWTNHSPYDLTDNEHLASWQSLQCNSTTMYNQHNKSFYWISNISDQKWRFLSAYPHLLMLWFNSGKSWSRTVSPLFFLGGTPETNFSYSEEFLPMIKFTDQKKMTVGTAIQFAKLLSRKFICKELLYTYVSLHWKTKTTEAYLFGNCPGISKFKIFMFIVRDFSWNPHWSSTGH